LELDEAAGVDCCQVVIQSAREVSNAVAQKTGVKHESPQVLLVRKGGCVWSVSHGMISSGALRDALKKNQ
jgi:bacillithiol system protein YtxJ